MPKQIMVTLDFGNATRIINLPNAVTDQEPATLAQLKAYIDGLKTKAPVRVATVGNISLTAPGATVDGVTMVLNDRVLVWKQTAGAENGIYIWNGAAVAMTILEGCGGKDNIASIDNCITRLRLEVKDITQVDDKKIKSAGVAGVMKPGKNSVQVIIGTKVQFVADEFSKLCE
jgi:glucose-like phosphotransferase system IIB component